MMKKLGMMIAIATILWSFNGYTISDHPMYKSITVHMPVPVLPGSGGKHVMAVAGCSDHVMIALGNGCKVNLYDISGGVDSVVSQYKDMVLDAPISHLALSPDGKYVAVETVFSDMFTYNFGKHIPQIPRTYDGVTWLVFGDQIPPNSHQLLFYGTYANNPNFGTRMGTRNVYDCNLAAQRTICAKNEDFSNSSAFISGETYETSRLAKVEKKTIKISDLTGKDLNYLRFDDSSQYSFSTVICGCKGNRLAMATCHDHPLLPVGGCYGSGEYGPMPRRRVYYELNLVNNVGVERVIPSVMPTCKTFECDALVLSTSSVMYGSKEYIFFAAVEYVDDNTIKIYPGRIELSEDDYTKGARTGFYDSYAEYWNCIAKERAARSGSGSSSAAGGGAASAAGGR